MEKSPCAGTGSHSQVEFGLEQITSLHSITFMTASCKNELDTQTCKILNINPKNVASRK